MGSVWMNVCVCICVGLRQSARSGLLYAWMDLKGKREEENMPPHTHKVNRKGLFQLRCSFRVENEMTQATPSSLY